MPQIPVRSPSGTCFALVSEEDADLAALRWHMAGGKRKNADGRLAGQYAARGLVTADGRKTTQLLHRVIAARMGLIASAEPRPGQHGRWAESIDHENGDKLDCQRSNLRLRDRPRQMRNPNDRLRSTNRSGFRGVSYVKMRERFGKPWMAYVTVNYRTRNLGWFATAEEAASARRQWDEQNGSDQS